MIHIDNSVCVANNRGVSAETRAYRSPLREARAEETRRRIVDATLRVLGSGAASFTVPTIATEAKVSLPTVYRLFPNKEALEQAARSAVRSRFGIDDSPARSLEDLLTRSEKYVRAGAEVDDAIVRAGAVLNARPYPAEEREARRKELSKALKTELAGVRGKPRRYALNMISLLFSSASSIALWRFGLLNDEGAKTLSWALRTLVDGARRQAEER